MAESRLKGTVQNWLKRMGLYHRVRASSAYGLYWRCADASLLKDRGLEVNFYRSVLAGFKRGDTIFDVGANLGHKTDIFLRLGAEVIAIDPDPTNASILEQSFLRYRLSRKPVTIVSKAVSDRSAVATLYLDEPGSAKNTLSAKWVDILRHDATRFGHTMGFGETRQVATTTLEDLIKTHGSPFYIKIDVEGHEPEVLRGLWRPVPWISFEVNLPEFRNEGLRCIELLRNLSTTGRFNYVVDCKTGIVLPKWLGPDQFAATFKSCMEKSVEVFWTSDRQ
jgi:FkbM family methyltransferase